MYIHTQRTLNNEELRENRKNQYTEAKTKYQAAIRKEKTNSWKQDSTVTSPSNPWNEVINMPQGKHEIRR